MQNKPMFADDIFARGNQMHGLNVLMALERTEWVLFEYNMYIYIYRVAQLKKSPT